jgi:hypothetical protein
MRGPKDLGFYVSLGFLIMLTAPHIARAQTNACLKGEVAGAGAEVASSRQKLLALQFGPWPDEQVPAAGLEAIGQMKDRLNRLVVAYMACVSTIGRVDPERIQRDLSALAHAFKLPNRRYGKEDLPKDFGKYGYELWFEVHVATDAPSLIGITASFDVPCAYDTVLWIFSQTHSNWQRVLQWQSKPYKEISGAFWKFLYGISPPDKVGNWFVVTSYLNGWCTSNWTMINYDVLRPSAGSPTPRAILSKSESIWRGSGDFGNLTVSERYFELRYRAQSIDPGVHNRVFVRRYAIEGDTARRIPPVAISPQDFTDEWAVSSWRDASAWSAKANLQNMRSMHERVSELLSDDSSSDRTYIGVWRCSSSAGAFQVGFCFGDKGAFYFRIESKPAFTMMNVKNMPDSDCAGRNLTDGNYSDCR